MNLELTREELMLVLAGLGSLTQDRNYSANRQHEAQQLAKRIWALDGTAIE
jgi:hypothetical protein